MKPQKPLLLLLVLGLVGIFLVNRHVFAKPTPTDETKRKWEYCRLYGSYTTEQPNHYVAQIVTASTQDGRVDTIDSNYSGVAGLNKLGADGWELVAVIPTSGGGGAEYILKRPKP